MSTSIRLDDNDPGGWRMLKDMSNDDEHDMLLAYGELHDGLSDMVESGRLTEADIPDDYQWLVEKLTELGMCWEKVNHKSDLDTLRVKTLELTSELCQGDNSAWIGRASRKQLIAEIIRLYANNHKGEGEPF